MSHENGMERLNGRRLAVELVWKDGLLAGLELDWVKPENPDTARSEWAAKLKASLLELEDGQPMTWPLPPLDWTGISGFRRRVLETLLGVDWGKLTTYGELASLSGYPGAARAVGGVMNSNPWSLVVP